MLALMASPKAKMINVRLTPEMHNAFKIACDLRGVSMSSFMHQTIARVVREEKEREPQAFARKEIIKKSRNSIAEEIENEKTRKKKAG